MDLTTVQGATEHMSRAINEEDWNRRTTDVKRANGGYPSFWYSTVIASGLFEKTMNTPPTFGVSGLRADGTTTSVSNFHAVTGEKLS